MVQFCVDGYSRPMTLHLSGQERWKLVAEVGGHVLAAADSISKMTTVEWGNIKEVLNPEIVEQAQSLHAQGTLTPAEALIAAGKDWQLERRMEAAAQNAEPFG